MAETNTVVQLPAVRPNSRTEKYRGHVVTVTFVPSERRWHWVAELTTVTSFTGDGKDMTTAIKAAKKQLDKILDSV